MRRFLSGKKAKCLVKSGDGVISREDMFWDLRSEKTAVHYTLRRYLRASYWRDCVTRLTTYGLDILLTLGGDWTGEIRDVHFKSKCKYCSRDL